MSQEPTSPKSDSSEDTRRYWEHLDAKFATFNVSPAPKPAPVAEPGPPSPPAPEPVSAPGRVPEPVGERQPASGLIAEAFGALLALEDGQPGARPVRLTFEDKTAPPVAAEATISDAVIEDVVRRVIERMAPDTLRALVADIVSETAERLVKDEIDRIRNQNV